MNIIDRAKNILFTPKTEWEVIKTETATPPSLLTGYVLPLAIIPIAVALLNGVLWWSVRYGIIMAVLALVMAIVSYYISIYITDGLATSFNSEKNLNKSAQLVAYSYTANAVASILAFIPGINIIVSLAGAFYAAYLMYLGTGPLKSTPEDKRIVYVLVIIAIQFVIGLIIGAIVTAVFIVRGRYLY